MPPPVKLSLFYDITSPWSYVAFDALSRYKAKWNLKLDLHPMFLGAVLIASKNSAPASVPNKAKWMVGDIQLLSDIYGLNMRLPEGFPWNKSYSTLNTMRFMRVLHQQKPDVLEEATRRLYAEFFQVNTPTNSPTFLHCLTRDPPLLTAAELSALVEASQTPENKAGLKTDAEQLATEQGAFGFPWIVCQKEGGERREFFGSDRMLSISHWLGKEYPYEGVDPDGGNKSKL